MTRKTRMIVDGSIRDLVRFEQKSRNWGPLEFVEWARRGAIRLIDPEDDASAQMPFMPLRIYPSGEVAQQFASAYELALGLDHEWPGHLAEALIEYLEETDIIDVREMQVQVCFWNIFARLEMPAAIVDLAYETLTELSSLSLGLSAGQTNKVVASVISAVDRSTASVVAKSQFHSDISHLPVWRSAYLPSFIAAWVREVLDSDVDDEEVLIRWGSLCDRFGERLDATSFDNLVADEFDRFRERLGRVSAHVDGMRPDELVVVLCDQAEDIQISADSVWKNRFKADKRMPERILAIVAKAG